MNINELNNPENNSVYIIAEAGLNHNGSIEIAKELIDVAFESGADAVKFQKRDVENLAINSILNNKDDRFPEFGKTYKEIREHLEFNFEDYKELKKYTKSKKLDFIVTAFDIKSVDFLNDLDIDAFKLASHSATNLPLLEYISQSKKLTILSTGMTEVDDIDKAVEILSSNNMPLALLHCVSAYPTPIEECNLNMINTLKERYKLPVGYSGHEIGFLPTISSVAMGAKIIERHYTLDQNMIGFDHKISLEPKEFSLMVENIRSISKMFGNSRREVSEKETITKDKYHVSMVSRVKIIAGTIITANMISYKNPGTGIPPKNQSLVLGKKAKKDIELDTLITLDMIAN